VLFLFVDVEKIYRERPDYSEGMAEIFNALAATELGDLARHKDNSTTSKNLLEDCKSKVVECIRRAEHYSNVHEYTNLIKGFFEIRQGEVKKAEDLFRAVQDIAIKKGPQKKKYLFAALVGLGIVAYSREKYSFALEHFSKALQKHPKSPASIRVAIASCCFKLKHFDRARAILEKALASDPSNADVLVLLALLEQVAAQKDKSKRTECRAHAYEYCLLATAMETSVPSTMMAMNQMANHCFHTWKLVVKGGESLIDGIDSGNAHVVVVGAWQIELELSRSDFKELFLQANDPIKVGSAVFSVNTLTSLEPLPLTSTSDVRERILIALVGKSPLEEQLIGLSSKENSFLKVEVKEFGRVFSLATEVYKKTTVNAVKAESIYILGRIYHAQNNIAPAIEYYKEAYRFCPDLALAIFGHAQIMLSKQELGIALELFEKVQTLHPDDRDTQAYVMLVRALYKRESSSLEKVREVASGFAHEVDLWLLQGQLRQTTPTEYSSALRCYTSVLECMERQNRYDNPGQKCVEDPRVLSNMAVLHHSLGRLTIALDFCRRSLIAQQQFTDIGEAAGDIEPRTTTTTNPVFKNQQFEGVFYSWSDAICIVQPDWTASGWEVVDKEKETEVSTPSEETKDSTATNGATTLFCTFEINQNEGAEGIYISIYMYVYIYVYICVLYTYTYIYMHIHIYVYASYPMKVKSQTLYHCFLLVMSYFYSSMRGVLRRTQCCIPS
jgi:tetratricopeptide (TPR) repeat protein